MKIKLWHIAVFTLALIVFAVARAPASLVAQQRPGQLTYARAEGTIWSGQLHDVVIGGYRAERASWRLALLDVVQGRAIVPIDFENGEIEGRVVLLGNIGGDRRIAAQPLRLQGLRLNEGVVLPGETTFYNVDILFEDGRCVRAQGRIVSDAFVQGGQALGWNGPNVEGRPRCEGDLAEILLTGANEAGERANVRVLLEGDGAASWRVSVLSERRETNAALAAAGFAPGVADPVLGYGGDTRWLP
jgi:hypothetical protein